MRLRELERRIEELERSARSFGGPSGVPTLLAALENAQIEDAALLARFHDALLFICAYPATPQIRRKAESLLKGFARRVATLERTGDITPLLDPEVSGIAGTSVDVIFSYDFLRWLAARFPGQLAIDWDDDSSPESRAAVFARLLPFLSEETSVDAHAPYGVWLAAAGRGLESLLAGLDAPAYDGLQLWIEWKLRDSPMTRTRLRRPARTIDYQTSPLVSRRDISIERELSSGEPLRVRKLSRSEGETVVDLARAAIAMRYRELYCFTFGDPSAVYSADCGRGLEIVLIGTLPSKRLPLRAGYGAFFFRNGVPIGYADALGLAERMEVSFNIFYAFRSGESAFCFARLLKLYHQLFGSTSFSIDPYQIGLDNEEAIEAGAFWFYRKLGFRASDGSIERIARREEQRIAAEPEYRTPRRTLRRIAHSPLVWGGQEWDRFHVRNIGLRIQKKFAASGESAAAFTESCRKRVAATLGTSRRAAGDLALVLDLIPFERWSAADRAAVRAIVLAKQGRSEKEYLRLLAGHGKLRRAIIAAGSY